MRPVYAVFLVIMVLVILIAAVLYIPSTDPYSPYNPYWNGYSGAVKVCNATITYYDLNNASTVILIPMVKPGTAFIQELTRFLNRGGTLIILDNGMYFGNYILNALNVTERFSETPVIDPVINYGNEHLPIAKSILPNATYVLLNNPTYIRNVVNGDVIVWSSQYSSSGGVMGPLPIVVVVDYGNGRLILVADPAMFINSMLGEYGNEELLKWMCLKGPVVFLDGYIAKPSIISTIREYLIFTYGYTHSIGVNYLLTIMPILIVTIWFTVRGGRNEQIRRQGLHDGLHLD